MSLKRNTHEPVRRTKPSIYANFKKRDQTKCPRSILGNRYWEQLISDIITYDTLKRKIILLESLEKYIVFIHGKSLSCCKEEIVWDVFHTNFIKTQPTLEDVDEFLEQTLWLIMNDYDENDSQEKKCVLPSFMCNDGDWDKFLKRYPDINQNNVTEVFASALAFFRKSMTLKEFDKSELEYIIKKFTCDYKRKMCESQLPHIGLFIDRWILRCTSEFVI